MFAFLTLLPGTIKAVLAGGTILTMLGVGLYFSNALRTAGAAVAENANLRQTLADNEAADDAKTRVDDVIHNEEADAEARIAQAKEELRTVEASIEALKQEALKHQDAKTCPNWCLAPALPGGSNAT